jgi:hypothetical protein
MKLAVVLSVALALATKGVLAYAVGSQNPFMDIASCTEDCEDDYARCTNSLSPANF